jgi:hypothetical protein
MEKRHLAALGAIVTALAIAVFLLTWRHISRLRHGGSGGSGFRLGPIIASAARRLPRHRAPFASPAAAQFWFEWRCSGLVLPVLVGGVLAAVIAPMSWFARHDASGSLHLLLGTLAMPVIFAIPVGMAFARPTFWSEDLSLPAFIAIRPLTGEEIVAIKMKVAAEAVAISWLWSSVFVGIAARWERTSIR